eukprot:5439474-Pyramimonas_sp.AAC.1
MTSPLGSLSRPPSLLEPGPSWAIFAAFGAVSGRFGQQCCLGSLLGLLGTPLGRPRLELGPV